MNLSKRCLSRAVRRGLVMTEVLEGHGKGAGADSPLPCIDWTDDMVDEHVVGSGEGAVEAKAKGCKGRKVMAAALAAALAAGCVPAMALAQAAGALPGGVAASSSAVGDLHAKVLAGEVLYPAQELVFGGDWDYFDPSVYTSPDGWRQSAYERDGKVVVEVSGRDADSRFWTYDELAALDPDVVVIRDYDNNAEWTIEGRFTFRKGRLGEYPTGTVEHSVSYIKVDAIAPGPLSVEAISCPGSYQFTGVEDKWGTVSTHMSSVSAVDCERVDGTPLTIGRNVTALPENWAAEGFVCGFEKLIVEPGSKLAKVESCWANIMSQATIKEVEGLPSGVKLDKGALAVPTLEKVTDEKGNAFKAPDKAYTAPVNPYSGKLDNKCTVPAAPGYWKGALKKVKSISGTAKARSGGKVAFAKVRGVHYKKAKVTYLAGKKYKRASKKASKLVTVKDSGKVTLKKGLKKGRTYKVSAKATCAGHKKTVTATIRVK